MDGLRQARHAAGGEGGLEGGLVGGEGGGPGVEEHGALGVVECWGDDVPEGKLTSFSLAVKREPDEVVVFSWITWPSRTVRDEAWKKLMADPRMQPGATSAPGPRSSR